MCLEVHEMYFGTDNGFCLVDTTINALLQHLISAFYELLALLYSLFIKLLLTTL